MSIIALGVSLYVHYIAFSKVAANSRAPQAPHYKLATTRSLQIRYNPVYKFATSVSLQIRYDPVTTNSIHKRHTTNSLQPGHYELAPRALRYNSLRALHYKTRYERFATNSLRPGHYELAPRALHLCTRRDPATTNSLRLGQTLIRGENTRAHFPTQILT